MGAPTETPPTPWHALAADAAAREFDVDPRAGLSSAEGARRLQRHGAARADRAGRCGDGGRRRRGPAVGARNSAPAGRTHRRRHDGLRHVRVLSGFDLLNVRHDNRRIFSRETLPNLSAFAASAVVIVVLAIVVEMDVLHGFFTTTDLTSGQWLACAAIGSSTLWIGELVKMVLRPSSAAAQTGPAPEPGGGRPPWGGALAARGPLPYEPVLNYGTASAMPNGRGSTPDDDADPDVLSASRLTSPAGRQPASVAP